MENSHDIRPAIVVVQARMGSSRLPGKMMMDLAGRPLIRHILGRAQAVRPDLTVVLATTALPRDDALAAVAAEMDIACVRGDEDDVMGRFLLALEEFPARRVVRICGDSPLFDPVHLERCLGLAEATGADVVKLRGDPPTLLQGGEVVSAHALRFSRRTAPDDPLSREHVTAFAMRRAEDFPADLKTMYIRPEPEMLVDVKVSIDTEEDLARLRTLYEALWDGESVLDLRAAAAWLNGPAGADWPPVTPSG